MTIAATGNNGLPNRVNKFYLAGIILYLLIIPQVGLYSQTLISEQRTPFSGGDYRISISQWITKGDFKMHGGPPAASNTWELTHPLDGNIYQIMFSAPTQGKENPYFINISLNSGYLNQGTIRDTDWDGNGVVTDLSYSDSRGDTSGGALSVDYRITDLKEPYELNLTMTYNYLDISANYRDPVIVVSGYVPTYTVVAPFRWNVNRLLYDGFEIGIKGKSDIMKNLSLSASLGYTPFTRAEYTGTRYPDTVYEQREHIIATGTTLNYELRLTYGFVDQFFIQGGYKYTAYRTEGKDQNDTSWSGSWEELDADFKGFFFGAGMKF